MPRTKFDPGDLLAIDPTLSSEELMVRDTVRAFVRNRVAPEIADWYAEGRFPAHLIPELGAMGLLGMQIDGYGCAGAGPIAHGLACMELEAGDSALRSFVSVQGSLAMFAIHALGSESQRRLWLPRMATGEVVGCFGLSEAEAGSDPGSMRTTARRRGQDWELNGSKLWITNGSIADLAVIWARTEDGIGGFLVTRGTPGFSAADMTNKLSMRASVTSELVLDGVVVKSDAQLPGAQGLGSALRCLDEARLGVAFGALGAARACFECALSHCLSRSQFGRPLASFQLVQQKLVEMSLRINQATLLVLHLARLKAVQQLSSAQISMAKMVSARSAREVAASARALLGASGITLDYPVMRHMNNLESVFTYEGTDDIQVLAVGQALTGLSAFR